MNGIMEDTIEIGCSAQFWPTHGSVVAKARYGASSKPNSVLACVSALEMSCTTGCPDGLYGLPYQIHHVTGEWGRSCNPVIHAYVSSCATLDSKHYSFRERDGNAAIEAV